MFHKKFLSLYKQNSVNYSQNNNIILELELKKKQQQQHFICFFFVFFAYIRILGLEHFLFECQNKNKREKKTFKTKKREERLVSKKRQRLS